MKPWPWRLIIASIPFVVVVLVYSNTFNNSFHFDDSHCIANNSYVQRGPAAWLDIARSADAFSALTHNQTYRPVTTISYAIDWWIGGGEPWPFHVTNVTLLMCLIPLLLWLYWEAIGESTGRCAVLCLGGATLLVVHVTACEVANYFSARSGLLATVLMLLGMLLHQRPGCRHHALAAFTLGCLAKQTVIIWPVLLFGWHILVYRNTIVEAWRKLKLEVLTCGVTWLIIDAMQVRWTTGSSDRWGYAATQIFVVARYFRQFLFPHGQCVDTGYQIMPWHDDRVLLGAIVLLTLSCCGYLAHRAGWRASAFGIFWFFVAIAPNSSFIPLSEVTNDHRAFTAYIGLGLVLVDLLNRAPRFPAPLVVGLLIGLHGFHTYQRNAIWATEETLWTDCVATAPNNARALMNLALAWMARGRHDLAEPAFRRVIEAWPSYCYAWINLGVCLGAQGKQPEFAFKQALLLSPRISEVRTYYARWLLSQGRRDEALALATEALAISPADAFAQAVLRAAKESPTHPGGSGGKN
jgi:hypothetical protein